ncbi:MAG: hypothetical protein CMF70_06800, partial [Magnetovibrio sp.]|nr:hypothetical protein [Magnetovibrio sp.]
SPPRANTSPGSQPKFGGCAGNIDRERAVSVRAERARFYMQFCTSGLDGRYFDIWSRKNAHISA